MGRNQGGEEGLKRKEIVKARGKWKENLREGRWKKETGFLIGFQETSKKLKGS